MSVREVLLLGNPKLYESCAPVVEGEIESLRPIVQDLHDTLMDFRRRHGAGRAIAAFSSPRHHVASCSHYPIILLPLTGNTTIDRGPLNLLA